MRRLNSLLGLSMLALAMFGATADAQQSQDIRPLLDRLDRLERDMNLLQRQVYRGSSASGAPVPVNPPGDTGSAALNLEVRVSQVEDQVRTLTGRIEETSYQLDQLRQRLDKLSGDIDFRLNQLNRDGGSAPSGPADAPPPAAGARGGSAAPRPSPGAGGNPSDAPSQSGILGTIEVPAGAPPSSGGASDGQIAGRPGASGGSAQDQYNFAFGLLRQSRYDEAEQALRAFIQHNPGNALTGNAQYWLGETYYVRKDYTNAAAAFAEGYEKYPKSSKAADNLLKLGMSLANLGQKDNACRSFARLDRDFPQAAAEIKDRSGAEKKRLGCTG